jgi:hypothetical protein
MEGVWMAPVTAQVMMTLLMQVAQMQIALYRSTDHLFKYTGHCTFLSAQTPSRLLKYLSSKCTLLPNQTL